MSVAGQTETTKAESACWALDVPVMRQGVFQAGERSVAYTLLRPSPDQWVVMALVPRELDASPTLLVTVGGSEAEAFRQLARRLRTAGLPSTLDAFVTEWAMSAPER